MRHETRIERDNVLQGERTEKERDEEKKHERQNSVGAVMAAARTVIAFPRISYYPRSTTPFICGDDASRVVVCVVVYGPLPGPFFFNAGDQTIVPPRLLFHFYVYDKQRVAVTVVEILEACPIDLWPWAYVVPATTGSSREVHVCATKCVARCRCMQEESPGRFLTEGKRAP